MRKLVRITSANRYKIFVTSDKGCRVTIGHIRVTLGHLRVTIGHLRVTIGYFFLSFTPK